jgi:hypothetical protein
VHPFDDDDFISGNGTIALEMVEDLPDVDAVIAPIGGGGLLAGIAAGARELKPGVAIYAAEPETAAPLAASLRAGAPVRFEAGRRRSSTARAADRCCRRCGRCCSGRVADSLVVTLDEAAAAMRLVADRVHVIAEGAAACAVAAAVSPAFAARGHRQGRRRRVGRQHRPGAFRVARRRLRVDVDFMAGAAAGRRVRLLENAAAVIPDRLARLPELGRDLWWTWNNAGPRGLSQARLPALAPDRAQPRADAPAHPAGDPGRARRRRAFLRVYDEALEALDAARSARDTWWQHRYPDAHGPIAYFSAEFALHQSLPIYAGGLGVLAGDHCKEASDLGIPLIGVGFMYPQGYFHQSVSPEGWQQESYERLELADAPIEPAVTPEGQPCVVAVPLGNRSVLARSGACGSAG